MRAGINLQHHCEAHLKRYTLEFQPLSSGLALGDLRSEAEQVLLRLHPRITYKIGQALEGLDGKLLVQYAADGKRQLLEQAFQGHTWGLPVQFEKQTWGWALDNADAALPASATKSLERDPLVDVQPLQGEGEYNLRKRLLQGRYITLMISTLALLVIFIVNAVFRDTPALMILYAVTFAVFMFSLSDTPLDIRVYADKISLQQHGLAVKFWLLPRSVSCAWDDIQGLDYINHVCVVLGKQAKLRFLLSERFGCAEQSQVLKTIVSRAGLMFVEGSFQKLVYRKPDAE